MRDFGEARHVMPFSTAPAAPRRLICWIAGMNSSDIITVLQAHKAAVKARGVAHAALFGSVARNEQRRGLMRREYRGRTMRDLLRQEDG